MQTVYKSIESSFSENPYMPREVRQGNESENIQGKRLIYILLQK